VTLAWRGDGEKPDVCDVRSIDAHTALAFMKAKRKVEASGRVWSASDVRSGSSADRRQGSLVGYPAQVTC
jgi:hypothetical protein